MLKSTGISSQKLEIVETPAQYNSLIPELSFTNVQKCEESQYINVQFYITRVLGK